CPGARRASARCRPSGGPARRARGAARRPPPGCPRSSPRARSPSRVARSRPCPARRAGAGSRRCTGRRSGPSGPGRSRWDGWSPRPLLAVVEGGKGLDLPPALTLLDRLDLDPLEVVVEHRLALLSQRRRAVVLLLPDRALVLAAGALQRAGQGPAEGTQID